MRARLICICGLGLLTLFGVACTSGPLAITVPSDINAGGTGGSGGTSITDASAGGDAGAGLQDALPIPDVSSDTGCQKPTCADLNAQCGVATDTKCGGIVTCPDCPQGQTCGASSPNQCGTGLGGDGGCIPKTCSDLNANCGPVSDQCSGLLQCGDCPEDQQCGYGGPNLCGSIINADACAAKSCLDQDLECGLAGDTCGNTLNCGSCEAGLLCGQGGPGKCGAPPCNPLTCTGQNISCGPAGDGCGHTLACGTCSLPKICGGGVASDGGTIPGQCGCTGVCAQIPNCPSGTTTMLTGKVYDPAGVHPLYNALVYVPNSTAALPAFGPVTCDQCGAAAAGDPLITTYTAPDGSFTLSGMPVGNIRVVVQLGRWRRQFTVPVNNVCGANAVSGTTFSMPATQAQGDIPHIAISTGYIDAMECVLYKMGVAQTEFTNSGGTGRINLFKGSGVGVNTEYGQIINSSTPDQSALFANSGGQPLINSYDMVIFACQGDDGETQAAADQAKVLAYANGGGRVFASHYSYAWLYNNGNFANTAHWDLDFDSNNSITATVDTNTTDNPKGPAFLAWLRVVGAVGSSSTSISIANPRWDTDSTISPTQQWIYANDGYGNKPLHFTFNTPVGASSASQCGRVLFSDFHVSESNDTGVTFPGACSGAMTPNELALEFMIFDLGSCVTPYTPVCTPETCNGEGIQCGPAGDGCGNLLQCGNCPTGQYCGVGGAGKCGTPPCTKLTCAGLGLQCGPAGDGCGGLLQCGVCEGGTCGGGGSPGKCGSQTCTPENCTQQDIQCGPAGDGCGTQIDCGSCPTGEVCGQGGPGKCGAPPCTPKSCSDQSIECGPAGDGCGNELQCGNCAAGYICGLSAAGKCGKVQ